MDKEFPYEEIAQYCKSKFPEEACGLVIVFKGKHLFIPCENVSEMNRQSSFAIHPLAYAEAEDKGRVVAVVHSHTIDPAVFSDADVAYQKQQGIHWLLVGLKESPAVFHWLKNEKKEFPLYGRKYVWHVHDCYSFIRDWYEQEMGIVLDDFLREEKFWEKGTELYLENFASAGFVEVPFSDLQIGDVLLMAIGGKITAHGAIYLGNNQIGHHLNGRLSSRDVLGQFYKDRITKVVRHKSRIKDET